jgi:hypothetical protein
MGTVGRAESANMAAPQSLPNQHARPFAIVDSPWGTEALVHRSRPTVLVIFAAVAACSTHDDAKGTDLLSQDRTLVARLQADRGARPAPLPAACGTVAIAPKPASANQTQAKDLTLQAQSEEMQGNISNARALLRRASELDATNQTAAFLLGRTNEALGDRTAAMTAYCRYLALTPSSAESADARQRVAELSKTTTRVSAGSVTESASTGVRAPVATRQRVTREQRTLAAKPPVARATVVQSAVATSQARGIGTPTPSAPAATSPSENEAASSTAAEHDVVVARDPAPAVDAPATDSRVERRVPSRTQTAIIGATTGAIIGAATGRSVKGAVIGAAAGGIFGTVVGGRSRPLVGRGIRS